MDTTLTNSLKPKLLFWSLVVSLPVLITGAVGYFYINESAVSSYAASSRILGTAVLGFILSLSVGILVSNSLSVHLKKIIYSAQQLEKGNFKTHYQRGLLLFTSGGRPGRQGYQ